MKTAYFSLCGAGALAILAGCASAPIVVSPVGPEPVSVAASASEGYLQVFTDTETHEIGKNTKYYPHTDYSVHDDSGRVVEFVANHIGNMDETPARVTLPANRYNIVAESSSYGRVTVPVVIQAGRLTIIHLDGDWKPPANTPKDNLVYLPDGEAVGWK
jgi:hypothetical protein